jgi:hypothetical protein
VGTSRKRAARTARRNAVLRRQALELLSIGLPVADVANELGVHRTTVWRLTRDVEIPTQPLYTPELTTNRAKTIWGLMMQEQERTRKRGSDALMRRIARAVLDVEDSRR